MTTVGEPLVLDAVVPEGAADEAIRSLLAVRSSGALVRRQVLVAAPFVGVAVLTRQPLWLLGYVALVGLLLWLRPRVGMSGLRTHGLPTGAVIRVEWGPDALVVHRPASTVHFSYDGMALATTTERLTGLSVRNAWGNGERRTLYLPSELVPAEAVARFHDAAAPGDDPFGAAEMPRVFRVPAGWPRVRHGLSAGRRLTLTVLLLVELLLLGALAAAGHVELVAGLLVLLLAGVVLCVRAPFRSARRLLPQGSLVGLSLADHRVAIALPDRRVDLPESRLRNVIPCGADLVNIQFTGTGLSMVPVPRQLLPDADIDRLRAVAGRRPLMAGQRLRETTN